MVITKLLRSLLAAMLLPSAVPALADFVVNTDSDADNGSDGACSLREAIHGGQQPGELQRMHERQRR